MFITLPVFKCSLNIYLHQYWKAWILYLRRTDIYFLTDNPKLPYNPSTHNFRNNFIISSSNSPKNPLILANKSACHVWQLQLIIFWKSGSSLHGIELLAVSKPLLAGPCNSLSPMQKEWMCVTSGRKQLRSKCVASPPTFLSIPAGCWHSKEDDRISTSLASLPTGPNLNCMGEQERHLYYVHLVT